VAHDKKVEWSVEYNVSITWHGINKCTPRNVCHKRSDMRCGGLIVLSALTTRGDHLVFLSFNRYGLPRKMVASKKETEQVQWRSLAVHPSVL